MSCHGRLKQAHSSFPQWKRDLFTDGISNSRTAISQPWWDCHHSTSPPAHDEPRPCQERAVQYSDWRRAAGRVGGETQTLMTEGWPHLAGTRSLVVGFQGESKCSFRIRSCTNNSQLLDRSDRSLLPRHHGISPSRETYPIRESFPPSSARIQTMPLPLRRTIPYCIFNTTQPPRKRSWEGG